MSSPPKVIFEDNHLLVVDKPAVLATMGAEPGMPSLLEDCKSYIATKYNKTGNVYLGVVSRLDAWVTGVIVFARTSKAAERLNKQFRDRTVEKTYWAIVSDRIKQQGELEDWVAKDDQARRMRVVEKSHPQAKLAKLTFEKLTTSSTGESALISVNLQTGRKHQIRVQLANLGFPIFGDRKYGSQIPFPRGIALHSRTLKFDHPTQKTRLEFESQLPKSWNQAQFVVS